MVVTDFFKEDGILDKLIHTCRYNNQEHSEKEKEQTSDTIVYKLQQLRECRNRQTDQRKRMDVRINENLV